MNEPVTIGMVLVPIVILFVLGAITLILKAIGDDFKH